MTHKAKSLGLYSPAVITNVLLEEAFGEDNAKLAAIATPIKTGIGLTPKLREHIGRLEL